ncbi:class I histocompatibility antigen, F10 alpha chain-like [Emydura macquarii macquarii]|uniref:class I histocompatibility antigen, F10 alpha chain-like n=1 Tax=Emydura macquarii macquarii TaxID=1129001 RepID=UPI00352B8B37
MGAWRQLLLVWLQLGLGPLPGLAESDPSGPHALSYHYAGTYDAGGLLEFWAAGQLDGAPLDGYDRATRTKVPARPWVRAELEPAYWQRGSISRAAKEDWFRRNVEILRQRTNQTQGQHTLQWAVGCELEPGGVVRGWYQFAYDGEDFLLFDPGNQRWLAAVPWAEATGRHWDAQPAFGHQLQGYLRDTCLEWLGRFLRSRRAWARKEAAPQLQAWAHPTPGRPGWLTLGCLAGGVPTRDGEVAWLRGNATLPGAEAGQGLPGGDGGYQRHSRLQVPEGEARGVRCQARHGDLETPLEAEWVSHTVPGTPGGGGVSPGAAAVGALGALGCLAGLVGALLLWRKRARWSNGLSRLNLVSEEEVAESS